MHLYPIACLLFILISADQHSTNESISLGKKYKLISKHNRHAPVVVHSSAKPKHNILVGRKYKNLEISNSISLNGKNTVKRYQKRFRKCESRKPKTCRPRSYSISYSSTSWTSSDSSPASTHRRRHHHERKVVVHRRHAQEMQ